MHHASTAAVGGVLANGHIYTVVIERRRGNHLARPDVRPVVLVRTVLVAFVTIVVGNGLAAAMPKLRWIAVVRPNEFQRNGLFLGLGNGFESIAPTVTTTEEDQGPVTDLAQRG